MARNGEGIEARAEDYDHARAFQEAFGVRDASWFLGKASRELVRYHEAADTEGRVDALLNFSNSVIALEDWALPGGVADDAAWRGELRSESPAHAFIVLIALIAKHRGLRDGRFAHLRIETGRVQMWSEDASGRRILEDIARVIPSARVVNIQTRIDDDQIEGYVVTIEAEGLMQDGRLAPLEQLMKEALSFWQARPSP